MTLHLTFASLTTLPPPPPLFPAISQAVVIGSLLRGAAGRRRATEKREVLFRARQEQSARKIQSRFRGIQGRRVSADLLEQKRYAAATRLEASWRGHVCRKALLEEEAARELARTRARRAAEEHAKQIELERLRKERRRERPLLWRGCMSLSLGLYTSSGHFEQRAPCFVSCYAERDAVNDKDGARVHISFEAFVAGGANKRLKPIKVSIQYLEELSSRRAFSTSPPSSHPGLVYDYMINRTKGKWRGGKGTDDTISAFAASTWAAGCVGLAREALAFLRVMATVGNAKGKGRHTGKVKSKSKRKQRLRPSHLVLIPSCRFRIVRKIDRTFAILDVKVSSSPIRLSGPDVERVAAMTAHSQRNTRVEVVACEFQLPWGVPNGRGSGGSVRVCPVLARCSSPPLLLPPPLLLLRSSCVLHQPVNPRNAAENTQPHPFPQTTHATVGERPRSTYPGSSFLRSQTK